MRPRTGGALAVAEHGHDGIGRRARIVGREVGRDVAADLQGLAPLFAELGVRADGLWTCVGEPALALLEPWLSVLVGTDAAPQRWQPSLRPHAGSCTLSLGCARPSLARSLAAQLAPFR